jgi:hypothetical protein
MNMRIGAIYLQGTKHPCQRDIIDIHWGFGKNKCEHKCEQNRDGGVHKCDGGTDHPPLIPAVHSTTKSFRTPSHHAPKPTVTREGAARFSSQVHAVPSFMLATGLVSVAC